MLYEKQTWVDNETPVDAEHLNHIEEGVAALSEGKVSLDEVVKALDGGGVNIVAGATWANGYFYASGGDASESNEYFGMYMRCSEYFNAKPGTVYRAKLRVPLVYDINNDKKAKLMLLEYDSAKQFLVRNLTNLDHASMTKTDDGYSGIVETTVSDNTYYIKIAVTTYGESPESWFKLYSVADSPYGQKLLPFVTEADNGKILAVVDGGYELTKPVNGSVVGDEYEGDCTRFSSTMRGLDRVDPFLFFTDPHLLQGQNYETRYSEYISSVEMYYDATPTAFIVCGGDWYGADDSYDQACYKSGRASARMRNNFNNCHLVIGNHDTNQSGVNDSGASVSGILTPETVRNLWNPGREANYYSFDGVYAKYYVLDTFGEGHSNTEYTRSQIAWLGNKLKDDDAENSAIFMHIGFTSNDGTFKPGTFVIANHTSKILQMCAAYNSASQTTVNDAQYDFSGCTGKVRFVLSGHTHHDHLDETTGIPVIATAELKKDGVPTFDLCIADYDNLKLHMVRIGSGEDRVVNMAT